MVEPIYLRENEPFPNNDYPVLYFENALGDLFGDDYTTDDVLGLFERNGYTNGWVNGIMDRHHFHSNAHEALACTKGEVRVQLGGPHGEMVTFRKGDVVLLPAGTSHKKLDATENFEIVGAYPTSNPEHDFQYGDTDSYDDIKERIALVDKPETDPVTGAPGNIETHWPD